MNTETTRELSSTDSIVFATPVGVPSAPSYCESAAMNTEFNMSWDLPISDNGSAITKYKVYINDVFEADVLPTVLEYTKTGLSNGTSYSLAVTAVNAVGESLKSSVSVVVPFGPQTVRDVLIVNQTISFNVDTNGRKVNDISILAIDTSPSVNENLFVTSPNTTNIVSGLQSFSKTFDFNNAIRNYLIIVRSDVQIATKTNFAVV